MGFLIGESLHSEPSGGDGLNTHNITCIIYSISSASSDSSGYWFHCCFMFLPRSKPGLIIHGNLNVSEDILTEHLEGAVKQYGSCFGFLLPKLMRVIA